MAQITISGQKLSYFDQKMEFYTFSVNFIRGLVNNALKWMKLCPLELLFDTVQTKYHWRAHLTISGQKWTYVVQIMAFLTICVTHNRIGY